MIWVFTLLILISCRSVFDSRRAVSDESRQAMVVLIVIDQMRPDYLYNFRYMWRYFFRECLDSCIIFWNAIHDHFPTYTAVGHATIATGLPPSMHGIVGNSWIEKYAGKIAYCIPEFPAKPYDNLLAPTISDWLRLYFPDSRSACVSLKDRASVLMCGRSADIAIWFSDSEGKWVSSPVYPAYDIVNRLAGNTPQDIEDLLPAYWIPHPLVNRLFISDSAEWEHAPSFWNSARFPHAVKEVFRAYPSVLRFSPSGIFETFRRASQLIQLLGMGTDSITDFLGISISTTDYVGHTFSPHSMEFVDLYIKLDSALASWLNWLNEYLGGRSALIVITADHGVAPNPMYAINRLGMKFCRSVPGLSSKWKDSLNAYLIDRLHIDKMPVIGIVNQQVYINPALSHRVREMCKKLIRDWLREKPAVKDVWMLPEELGYMPDFLQRSYHPGRSGDVLFLLRECVVEYPLYGATHGSHYDYDSRVPVLVFYIGRKNKPVQTWERVSIRGLAPWILFELGIMPYLPQFETSFISVMETVGSVN